MRALWGSLVIVLVAASGCGGGTAPVTTMPDGAAGADGGDGAAPELDARDAENDAADADEGEAEPDAAFEAGAEDVAKEAAVDVAMESSPDVAAEAAPDGPKDVVSMEAAADLAVEKVPASATWTIAPNPMCTAAGAGCMDTGSVGGYQITASGTCPTASSVQLWFPGGQAKVAPGSYTVKAAAGILDVISMPAGMVGVRADRDDASKMRFKYWGRAGTVTVTAVGVGRHVSFTGVTLREEASAAMTTLAAEVTCP